MKSKAIIPLIVILLMGLGLYLFREQLWSSSPEQIQATGTIEATTVDLGSKISGLIDQVLVQEGQKVKAGQLVAVLSRSDLVAQKERDALGVQVAETRLRDLQMGAREEELKEARIQVESAGLGVEQARLDLSRSEALTRAGALPQEKLDQASFALQQKEALLASAQARLELLQAGARPEAVAGAQAEVARSRAVLKASLALLQDLNITAPRDGTVISRNHEPGEFVNAGSPLITLADLEHLWIKVYIPTDQLPAIHLQQKVEISVSGSSQKFAGTVTHIADRGEYTPKSVQTKQERANVVFAVKVSLDKSPDVIKPGMPADVTFLQEPLP